MAISLDLVKLRTLFEKHAPAGDTWADFRDDFLQALCLHWCMDNGIDLGVPLGGAKIGALMSAAWGKRVLLEKEGIDFDQRAAVRWAAARVRQKRAGE